MPVITKKTKDIVTFEISGVKLNSLKRIKEFCNFDNLQEAIEGAIGYTVNSSKMSLETPEHNWQLKGFLFAHGVESVNQLTKKQKAHALLLYHYIAKQEFIRKEFSDEPYLDKLRGW